MISGPIFQALRGLVDNRCYPSTFPQPPAIPEWPAIRYTISADANPDLCGTDDGSTDNFTVQFDCVGKTYGAADTLRDQVVAALEGFAPPAVREFENQTYDTETKTHRVILVYSVHPSYIGPLQVLCREIAGVLDVCDATVPASNPSVAETSAVADACAAGTESAAAVSESAAVNATDAVEPSTLEAAAIFDTSSVALLTRVASRAEVAAAVDTASAGGILSTGLMAEAGALTDAPAAIIARAALQIEDAAADAPCDATTSVFSALVVSWLSVTETEVAARAYCSAARLVLPISGAAPERAYVAWAQLALPEPSERAYVAWAQVELPEPSSVSRAFLSWAKAELPEP